MEKKCNPLNYGVRSSPFGLAVQLKNPSPGDKAGRKRSHTPAELTCSSYPGLVAYPLNAPGRDLEFRNGRQAEFHSGDGFRRLLTAPLRQNFANGRGNEFVSIHDCGAKVGASRLMNLHCRRIEGFSILRNPLLFRVVGWNFLTIHRSDWPHGNYFAGLYPIA
jgi:hypothetical protein